MLSSCADWRGVQDGPIFGLAIYLESCRRSLMAGVECTMTVPGELEGDDDATLAGWKAGTLSIYERQATRERG